MLLRSVTGISLKNSRRVLEEALSPMLRAGQTEMTPATLVVMVEAQRTIRPPMDAPLRKMGIFGPSVSRMDLIRSYTKKRVRR